MGGDTFKIIFINIIFPLEETSLIERESKGDARLLNFPKIEEYFFI